MNSNDRTVQGMVCVCGAYLLAIYLSWRARFVEDVEVDGRVDEVRVGEGATPGEAPWGGPVVVVLGPAAFADRAASASAARAAAASGAVCERGSSPAGSFFSI